MSANYSIELWDINGQPVADISRISSGRSYSLKLNDAETISLSVDMVQFENLCTSIGKTPRTVLFPGRTEIKIKRNNDYIVAGQIVKVSIDLSENDAKLKIDADGYLNYFLQRFIKKTYTSEDRSQIAWDAIDTTQSLTNGDFGITQGNLVVTSDSDRDCDYDEIKDLITDYTHQGTGVNYDFEFTPDKVFNTYTRKGSDKPEVKLIYPQNVASLSSDIDASTVANKIIGFGSGIGDERLESIKSDATSQSNYKVREKKSMFNSVIDQTTLDSNTSGVLALYKETLEIPTLTLNDGVVDIDTLETGDSVYVSVEGHSYLDNMKGMFRINEIDVSLDENDAETVNLKFYNPLDGGALENA